MPKTGCTFINKFLLPSLNSKKFGLRLMWLDSSYSIFQLQWNHKSASDWTRDDAEVFVEWDKIKHRDLTDEKDFFSKSKQRFRANLYKFLKSGRITELKYSEDKYTKVYCIGDGKNIPKNIRPKIWKEKPFIEKSEFNPEWLWDIGRIGFETSPIWNEDSPLLDSRTDVKTENYFSSENEYMSSGYHSDNSLSLYPMTDDFELKGNASIPHSYFGLGYDTMYVNVITSDKSPDISSLGLESSLYPYFEEANVSSPYNLNGVQEVCDGIKTESLQFGDLETTTSCEIVNARDSI